MTRSDLPEQRTDVRGTTIAWTEEGPTGETRGGTVVWAHGLSSTRDAQEEAHMLDWSAVAAGHRLIRYDARGHGSSTATPDASAYEWPRLADDLLALLDEIVPGETVAGIGSSMGTATLVHAALADPGRFSKLVLTAPPTAWETRAAQSSMYNDLAALIEQQGVAAFQAMAEGMEQPPVFAEVDDAAFGLTGESAPTVFRGAAVSDLPPRETLVGIEVPVLLLAWAQDPGHPVITSSILAEYLPDAVMRVAATPAQLAQWGGYAAAFLDETRLAE